MADRESQRVTVGSNLFERTLVDAMSELQDYFRTNLSESVQTPNNIALLQKFIEDALRKAVDPRSAEFFIKDITANLATISGLEIPLDDILPEVLARKMYIESDLIFNSNRVPIALLDVEHQRAENLIRPLLIDRGFKPIEEKAARLVDEPLGMGKNYFKALYYYHLFPNGPYITCFFAKDLGPEVGE